MISSAVLTNILQQLGQEGGEVEVLKGATSSLVFRVGEGILRVHTNQDWLHEEPDLVLHEVFALRAAGDLDQMCWTIKQMLGTKYRRGYI